MLTNGVPPRINKLFTPTDGTSPEQIFITGSEGIREPVGHLTANRFPTPHHRIFKTSGFKAGRFCIMSKKRRQFPNVCEPTQNKLYS